MTDTEDRAALIERAKLIKQILKAHERKKADARPLREWFKIARPHQLQPEGDDWSVWLIMAGRGWGKSRTGGEWMLTQVEKKPGCYAIVAPTWSDVEQAPVAAFLGALKSAGYREREDYRFNKSKLVFTFNNGSEVRSYSAETPDRIRGINLSGAWCDELAFFPKLEKLWTECLGPALRIGDNPITLVTTTPRPVPFLKELVRRNDTYMVRGSTFDNRANLSPKRLQDLMRDYEGTRVGRQELYGELLEDAEFALWNREMLEEVQWIKPLPQFARIIVAVDPSGSADGDATGIIVAGVDNAGVVYVLADETTKGSPEHRYETACLAAAVWGAGTIVYEAAYGGDNIAHGLRSAWRLLHSQGKVEAVIPLLKPSPTKTSKADRAHPVVALYEQTAAGMPRVYHGRGLNLLEDEMVQWEPSSDWSPNRMDALVHAVRFLVGAGYSAITTSSFIGMGNLPALPIR